MTNKMAKKLIGILAFTTVFALALIITGITLLTFPTELVYIDRSKQVFELEYSNCAPLNAKYSTCEDYFKDPNKQTNSVYCECLVEVTATSNLTGDIQVHCQLEFIDTEISNSSVQTFKDTLKNTWGQCNPYIYENRTANDTCQPIPDSIFDDEFTLQKELPSSEYKANAPVLIVSTYVATVSDVGDFSKSTRWSLDSISSKIVVLMNSKWTLPSEREENVTNNILPTGKYVLLVSKFYQNKDITRRTLIFSTQTTETYVTHRSNVLDVIALVLGLVLLAVSIAVFALRKRILGVNMTTEAMIPAGAPSNTQQSGPALLPEVKSLPLSVNNDT